MIFLSLHPMFSHLVPQACVDFGSREASQSIFAASTTLVFIAAGALFAVMHVCSLLRRSNR